NTSPALCMVARDDRADIPEARRAAVSGERVLGGSFERCPNLSILHLIGVGATFHRQPANTGYRLAPRADLYATSRLPQQTLSSHCCISLGRPVLPPISELLDGALRFAAAEQTSRSASAGHRCVRAGPLHVGHRLDAGDRHADL